MGDYEQVNREIQDFLMRRQQDAPGAPPAPAPRQPDISALLESLNATYGEINAYLRSGDADAVKNVILKSDIKMSLVCETLLQTLKATTEEKNRLQAENSGLQAARRRLDEELAQLKIRAEWLANEKAFKENNVAELNRVIRDQKDRIADARGEMQQAKNDAMLHQARVQELENLRERAAERLAVYEKEMEAMAALVNERDARIAEISREKRAEEEKNSGIKQKMMENERLVEALNKKLQARELNLGLCNSELSKVINENKMMKGDFEKYREKSTYYERLYESLSKQNAYLNSQLSRMLRAQGAAGGTVVVSDKYKRKNAKKKRRVAALQAENSALKKKVAEAETTAIADTVCTDSTEPLVKRIEELTTANKDFRRRIGEIEGEKRDIERKIARLERETNSKPPAKPVSSFRDTGLGAARPSALPVRCAAERPYTAYKPGQYAAKSVLDSRGPAGRGLAYDYKTDIAADKALWGHRDRDLKPFTDVFSSPNFISPLMPEIKGSAAYPKPNLENNYDTADCGNLLGAFPDAGGANSTLLSAVPAPANLSNLFGVDPPKQALPAVLFGSALRRTENNATIDVDAVKRDYESKLGAEMSRLQTKPAVVGTPRRRSVDEPSDESIKTFHTTSSLKDMIARTDKLQRRFESLEEQLANIKDGNTEEKLNDKIRTYNTRYSELNIDSNDSDFI